MSQADVQEMWMRQWRRAAIALAEVRRQELAEMTNEAALAAAERVLAQRAISTPLQAAAWSGLVEQQRLFLKGRR